MQLQLWKNIKDLRKRKERWRQMKDGTEMWKEGLLNWLLVYVIILFQLHKLYSIDKTKDDCEWWGQVWKAEDVSYYKVLYWFSAAENEENHYISQSGLPWTWPTFELNTSWIKV
jgi:hypothetical protein